MPFADMSVQNREGVLDWARRHEWGREAVMSAEGVLFGVIDPLAVGEGETRISSLNFTSLHDLAGWAGY